MIEKNKTLFLSVFIFLASSAGYISTDLYLPSLPHILFAFGVSVTLSQLTISIFLVSFAFSQLIYGPLSDFYGRKHVLLMGMMVYLVGTVFCVFADSITLFLIARFLQGLGVGAAAVLSRVMLRDSYSGDALAKMSSVLNTGVSVVTTIALGVGGLVQASFGYKGNFTIMLIFGAVVLCLLPFLPETNKAKESQKSLTSIVGIYRDIFKVKTFTLYVVCSGVALSSLIIYSMTNPFIIQVGLKKTAYIYGLCALGIAFFEVAGSVLSSCFVAKLGAKKMLLFGLSVLLMSALLMLLNYFIFSVTLFSVLVTSMLAAMGVGVVFPNASANAFSLFKKNIGQVGAVYGFLQLLISSIVVY